MAKRKGKGKSKGSNAGGAKTLTMPMQSPQHPSTKQMQAMMKRGPMMSGR